LLPEYVRPRDVVAAKREEKARAGLLLQEKRGRKMHVAVDMNPVNAINAVSLKLRPYEWKVLCDRLPEDKRGWRKPAPSVSDLYRNARESYRRKIQKRVHEDGNVVAFFGKGFHELKVSPVRPRSHLVIQEDSDDVHGR